MPAADPEKVKQEIEDVIGLDASDAVLASAKQGVGIPDSGTDCPQVPAPTGDLDAPLKALVFDSVYDDYRRVVMSVRVFEERFQPGDKILLMNSGSEYRSDRGQG